MKNPKILWLSALSVSLLAWTAANCQITPLGDAYINTAAPTTNFGTSATLSVVSPSQTTFLAFDLSSIPAGYTGANVAKATLKVYVNAVTTAGSFNVDFVNGSWSESTLTASSAPALGTTVAASVPLVKAQVNDYVLVDVTAAVQTWLNGAQPNDGLALVANSPLNASFDSKENTAQSHPAELNIVFTGNITGMTTAPGSGLQGGGTGGTLNLGLTRACAANQILQWNGSLWLCANTGTGTITGVMAGKGLTGGGNSGSVTLNLDTTKVPQLAAVNTFTANQIFTGNVGIGTSSPGYPLTLVSSSYQPLFVQSSSNFGTWLQLNNTSTGGHNWALLSAGGGNSEGAGNLGITNFTGTSTIFLEGNVNVGANLTVRGNVNPINIVGTNTFLPLTVQSPSTFGTWLELNNTSTGGHNWAILSAGGGNSEGAGNLGITNFTGTSTIFLEGNVQTNSLNSTGNVTVGGNLDMGFSYVIGPTTAVSPGTEATTVAICPAGTKIMSGGFDITPGPNGAQVLSNVPGLVAQDRWVVRVFNNGGSSVSVVAEAVCARLVVAQCCF